MSVSRLALRHVAACGLLLLLGATVAEASLERARELAHAGRLVEARRLLDELAAADLDAGERAETLALLGGVAARQGELEAARAAWTELDERYPDSPFAWEAGTGLELLRRLGEPAEEDAPAATRVAAAPRQADPPADPSQEAAAEVAAVEPAPPAAAPASGKALPPAATPRLVVPRAQMSNAVLVAGDGEPPEVIEEVIARVVERLRAAGVDAEMIPVEVWWRRSYKLAEPALYQTVREAGAASLIWVQMRFGFREKFAVACYSADGKRQFQERGSGGSAFAQDHRPHDEYNEELVERVLNDVEERAGGPCLPTG